MAALQTAEDFAARVSALADAVDEHILAFLSRDEQVPNLHDGMLYAMGLDVQDRAIRGKRIRPALGVMTAEVLGAPAERAMAFACAIELLHNFALVHDDIEDGDTQRRGRACTHLKYGLPHGVNIGDFLFSKVFSIIVHDEANDLGTREQLLRLLTETMDQLFAGQSLDISARQSRHFTMADYARIVLRKTGSYLAAPMLGGAIVAGAGEDVLEPLRRFGNALGPMFQIRDDVIDLTSGKGRDRVGNDIREGKRSYLVAALAETAPPADAERAFDILDLPREDTSEDAVAELIALFGKHGAIARAEAECARLKHEGLAAIEGLPAPLRAVLTTAAEVLSRRTT